MAGVGSGGRVAFEASSRRRAAASIRWSAATSANRLRRRALPRRRWVRRVRRARVYRVNLIHRLAVRLRHSPEGHTPAPGNTRVSACTYIP